MFVGLIPSPKLFFLLCSFSDTNFYKAVLTPYLPDLAYLKSGKNVTLLWYKNPKISESKDFTWPCYALKEF